MSDRCSSFQAHMTCTRTDMTQCHAENFYKCRVYLGEFLLGLIEEQSDGTYKVTSHQHAFFVSATEQHSAIYHGMNNAKGFFKFSIPIECRAHLKWITET